MKMEMTMVKLIKRSLSRFFIIHSYIQMLLLVLDSYSSIVPK